MKIVPEIESGEPQQLIVSLTSDYDKMVLSLTTPTQYVHTVHGGQRTHARINNGSKLILL